MIYSPKKFNVRYQANFNSIKKNNLKIWISQPLDSELQNIKSFSISPKPREYYKDEQGNKILYFKFKEIKNLNIQMNIKARLWKSKIKLKEEEISLPENSSKLFQQYTKNERFLEKIPDIKKLAKKITPSDNEVLNSIQSIFDFIINNFKYCYPVKQRGVKYLNLKKLKGDCGEYSGLFVTFCRILKIPCRNNTGFVIFPKQKNISEHGWASAYFKPFGWLDFDTQYASLEKNPNAYFGQRNDYKITFTNGFNIPLKPFVSKNFKNNLDLPIINSSVQTLQPIAFTSEKKVSFEEKIGLI